MSVFKIASILLVAIFAQAQSQGLLNLPINKPTSDTPDQAIIKQFKEFTQKFYPNGLQSGYDIPARLAIFAQTLQIIKDNNNDPLSPVKLAITQFADKTRAELQALTTGVDISLLKPVTSLLNIDAIFKNSTSPYPESFNWTAKGAVTPVKTGALEGMLAIQSGLKSLKSLSEQNLLDCMSSDPYYNYTCANGGWTETALDWVHSNGISSDTCYGYTGVASTCLKDQNNVCPGVSAGSFEGLVATEAGNNEFMKFVLINYGPVAIAIYADQFLGLYASGIWSNYGSLRCNQQIWGVNHAVLVVGYDKDPIFGEYWIVKNSWGTTWGDQGYFKIAMNGDPCGVTNYGIVPVIKKDP